MNKFTSRFAVLMLLLLLAVPLLAACSDDKDEKKESTEAATEVATEAATEVATEAATEVATEAATEVATEVATEAATEVATEVATEEPTAAPTATKVPTEKPTEEATEVATEAATEEATEVATEVATEAATEEAAAMTNLLDTAEANGLTTVVTALGQAADAKKLLEEGEGPYTLFAPSNDAVLAALGSLGVAPTDIIGNTELLTNILSYHVVAGQLLAADLSKMDGEQLDALNGEKLEITVKDGKVSVGGIEVVTTDILASNGVIHVIDGLLVPPSAMEVIQAMLAPAPTEAPTTAPRPTRTPTK